MQVLDRHGHLLATLRPPGEAARPVRLSEVDPRLIAATLAAEDRRFLSHPGIDLLAAARAAFQNLRAGRRVSGGSTITQQVVKLSRGAPDPTRGWRRKAAETWEALVLDAHASKTTILQHYMNVAPYGKNLQGVATAAQAYWQTSPATLAWDQAALLAALPQNPIRSDPRREPAMARAARDRVLGRMRLPPEERRAAIERGIELSPPSFAPRAAPHWIEHARGAWPEASQVTLPVDPSLQREAEAALRSALAALGSRGADAGAIVLLHNPSGEVRAWVGSADWSDPGHGQFDAALARRQAGSTLKPFAYALAFEEGYRPASLLPDLPVEYAGADGSFRPRNYAGRYHGPVRARTALANSWNAPAVALADAIGTDSLLERLRRAGLSTLEGPASRYGLGLILGVGEVTLLDLAAAYAVLARGGIAQPRVEVLDVRDGSGRQLAGPGPLPRAASSETSPAAGGGEFSGGAQVFTPQAAFFALSILADPLARARAFGRGGAFDFPFPVAIKTGTSSDWRDNWAVACTRDWTAAAWVGQAAGAPMDRVSGTNGAILAIRELLVALDRRFDLSASRFPLPPSSVEQRPVCALSGERPGAGCPDTVIEWFDRHDPPGDPCLWHQHRQIDRSTGRAASPETPADRRQTVLCVFPSPPAGPAAGAWRHGAAELLDGWCREQGWPQPPAASPAMAAQPPGMAGPARDRGEGGEVDRVRIIRPAAGSIYILDPSLPARQQAVALEGDAGGDTLAWSVDGEPLGVTRPGERLFWPLQPGSHRIRAELVPRGASGLGDRGDGRRPASRAAEVTIEVELPGEAISFR